MKLITDLNSLLAELQTWTHDEGSRDNKVAALKSFAKRAANLLHGDDAGITIEFPKEDRALRKLLSQAINQCLEARGYQYQTTGRHFTVKPSEGKSQSTGGEVCRICSGGPGNEGVCLCGAHAYGEPEAPSPPALVPLGPNRMADGRRVEVLRNDLTEGRPIVARIYRTDGTYFLAEYLANGAPHGGLGHECRLVGHLPPEPMKPREYWLKPVAGLAEALACVKKPVVAEERGYRLFREVLPDTVIPGLTDPESLYLRNLLDRKAQDPDDRRAKDILKKLQP